MMARGLLEVKLYHYWIWVPTTKCFYIFAHRGFGKKNPPNNEIQKYAMRALPLTIRILLQDRVWWKFLHGSLLTSDDINEDDKQNILTLFRRHSFKRTRYRMLDLIHTYILENIDSNFTTISHITRYSRSTFS